MHAHLAVDVIACARPRYVFCRKENWKKSFWQMRMSVPVVLRPYTFERSTSVAYNGWMETALRTSARRKKAKR